jgi:nucleoside-diphosphate-sugar epimerase
MKILLTGHDGYIGTVLARRLVDAGHDVEGLDTFYYHGCSFGPELAAVPGYADDVRDTGADRLGSFDAVVHLAALSNDPLGDLDSALTYDINQEGTVALARAAKEAGVRRFVFASSCSMYGAGSTAAPLDEDAPLAPLTPYAESKVRAEEALDALADSDFTPVSMRNATAYGASPRLRLDVVLNNLTAWAYTTGEIRLQSDGTSWRPIVHVRDIAEAAVAILAAPADQLRQRAYNIGANTENYQVRDLAEIVQELVPGCQVAYAEGASADPRSYRVDFSRFADDFPDCNLTWTAKAGAAELLSAYAEVGLTREMFEGRRYVRLGQIKRLRDAGLLDDSLRWSSAP